MQVYYEIVEYFQPKITMMEQVTVSEGRGSVEEGDPGMEQVTSRVRGEEGPGRERIKCEGRWSEGDKWQ